MPRGSLIASLVLHAGVVAIVCGAALRERAGGGSGEDEPQWIGVAAPAGELVAAEPAESGDEAVPVEQVPVRQPASAVSAAIRVSIEQTIAPMTMAFSWSVASAPANIAPPSFAKDRGAGGTAATGTSRAASRKGDGGRGIGAGNGQQITPARYAFCPPPPFPPEARKARLSGTAVLMVQIDARGRPSSITLRRSSGHAVFDAAALRAVRAWRFEPAKRDGQPVDACLEIPVRFALS